MEKVHVTTHSLAFGTAKTVYPLDLVTGKETNRIPQVETACSRLIRNFDAAQRVAFFGDENYPKLCEGLP